MARNYFIVSSGDECRSL